MSNRENVYQMARATIFKGCTRPAMIMGIPIAPAVIAFGGVSMLAMWFNLLIFILLVPIYFIMRAVVKHDDQGFRLLGLRWLCRIFMGNYDANARFWGSSSYAPMPFKKRKNK